MGHWTSATLATLSLTTATPSKSKMDSGLQFTPTKRRLNTSQLPILEHALKPALSRQMTRVFSYPFIPHILRAPSREPREVLRFTYFWYRCTRGNNFHSVENSLHLFSDKFILWEKDRITSLTTNNKTTRRLQQKKRPRATYIWQEVKFDYVMFVCFFFQKKEEESHLLSQRISAFPLKTLIFYELGLIDKGKWEST